MRAAEFHSPAEVVTVEVWDRRMEIVKRTWIIPGIYSSLPGTWDTVAFYKSVFYAEDDTY